MDEDEEENHGLPKTWSSTWNNNWVGKTGAAATELEMTSTNGGNAADSQL